ncbi:MAG TPA: nucleoside hydrolase [Chloroflexota bacterium]|nr:nucleoside hydrolase [Chloroflexota bacterium]
MTQKIHLDTDLGGDTDDLCALAMVLAWPNVELAGVTTVTDENGRRAGYVKYALKLAGREDLPVKAGADVSGGYYLSHPGYPDEQENWPEPVAPSPNPADEALELLKASIERGALVVGIGQYTNLFLLDQKYPGILRQAQLYLMGGYVYPVRDGYPQWGNDQDYNVQLDVRSAIYVLENSDPTLIPMSVTLETAIRRVDLPRLRRSGPVGALIARQLEVQDRTDQNQEKLGKRYRELPDDFLNFQHDPLACAVALGWEGVTVQEVPLELDIKDGLLWETVSPNGKVTKVVTRVDGPRFNEFWLDTVSATQSDTGASRGSSATG